MAKLLLHSLPRSSTIWIGQLGRIGTKAQIEVDLERPRAAGGRIQHRALVIPRKPLERVRHQRLAQAAALVIGMDGDPVDATPPRF